MAEVLTPTQHNKIIDKLATAFNLLRDGMGDGSSTREATTGESLAALQMKEMLEGSADSSFAVAELQTWLVSASLNLIPYISLVPTFLSHWSGLLAAVSQACAQSSSVDSSIVSIETYQTWYNTGNGVTYWQAMAPPEWRTIAFGAFRGYPTSNNVYFPCIEGGTVLAEDDDGLLNLETFTNALLKVVRASSVDTLTAGKVIDPTKYAGGRPFVQWTGGAGSGASSIELTGLDQNGDIEVYTLSGTWGVGDFVATQTGAVLTPTNNPNSLITKAVSVDITGMTDAEIFFEARPPLNRSYPTT